MVGLTEELLETVVDFFSTERAEMFDEQEGVVDFLLAAAGVFDDGLCAGNGAAPGEEFGADVDEASEDELFTFQFGAEFEHGVEDRAGEFAAEGLEGA